MKRSLYQQIKKILIYSRAYWPHLTGFFLLSFLATPIALLKPYALKLMIDSGFGGKELPGFIRFFFSEKFEFNFSSVILIASALVIIIALLENVYNYINWVLETYVGEKLVLHLRTKLFDHIQRLSLAYHDRRGSSDSLYRIQWDTMSIRALLLNQVAPLLTSFITLISMIVVMFMINKSFALIALCVIPPLYFLTKLSSRLLRKDWYKVKDAESVAMSVIHEVLGSIRVVKSFGGEGKGSERFRDTSNEAVKGHLKMARIGALFSFIIGMLIAIGTAAFIYLGAHDVHEGKMTLGELTLVLAYLVQVFGPLQSISQHLNELQSSFVSLDRVFTVLEEENEVKESEHALPLHHLEGSFSFHDVSFSYEKEKQTLQHISFDIRPGDRVGIMGATGAGKSTLISLLNRFYDPSSGIILADGKDIRQYKTADYRRQFGIVLQEPVLFSTTIAENIRYGKPDATRKEIMDAAIAANIHEFIMNNEDGYDAMVGERGMKLSGGERQRISLARAFIKNSSVLILDEPTSSLDVRTEAAVMKAMQRLMEGRTVFMITHRLDTLSSCNVILYLKDGKLSKVARENEIDFPLLKEQFLNS